jgi:hypothetical protein
MEEQEVFSMAIRAIVTPAAPPEVGTDVLTALRNIQAPEVFVPTSHIQIGNGEKITIQTGGELVVNGTLSGVNLGTGSGSGGGATNLDQLTDVATSNVAAGHVLKYNGTNFVNTAESTPQLSIGNLTDVTSANYADNSVLQFDSASESWVSRSEVDFIEGHIDGGVANSTFDISLNIDGGSA